jgi:hypothetical protein
MDISYKWNSSNKSQTESDHINKDLFMVYDFVTKKQNMYFIMSDLKITILFLF